MHIRTAPAPLHVQIARRRKCEMAYPIPVRKHPHTRNNADRRMAARSVACPSGCSTLVSVATRCVAIPVLLGEFVSAYKTSMLDGR